MEKTYPNVRYSGKRISPSAPQPVYRQMLPDGRPTRLYPEASQKVCNHSPDGFQWGYNGSSVAQLALAILLDFTGDPEFAQAHYQDFKFDIVSGWGDEWEITDQDILKWLESLKAQQNQLTLNARRN